MNAGRKLAAVLVSAVVLLTIGALARAPEYNAPGGEGAWLRLSWRLRGEKSERCRKRTQAELDALAVHMRTPEVCEGHLAAYRLVVQVDEQAPYKSTLRPAGVRGDRPLFVMHEQPLTLGRHRVRVTFTRLGEHDDDEHDDDDDDDGDEEAGEQEEGERFPPRLAIDTVITASRGAVTLVTVDHEARRLVLRAPSR